LANRAQCNRRPHRHDGQVYARLVGSERQSDSASRTPDEDSKIQTRAPLPSLGSVGKADPPLPGVDDLDPLPGCVNREGRRR
jgi:hypothetical protein